MLAEALEHLVRGIVDHPDDVVVRDKQLRRGSILEVRVHPDDLGKVIGRNGRTATAFRTVVSALAGRVLIALFFVPAGAAKLGDIAGNMAYTASGGLPGWFVFPALALEIAAGLAILAGWQTRAAALALAAFAVASLLTLLALVTLVVKSIVEWRGERARAEALKERLPEGL